MSTALKGMKVIDCSQVAAVPMCARILGDFGADVIHIENPTTGDYWRSFLQAQVDSGQACPSPDFDYNWENYNRNKRSVTLDLTKNSGRAIIHNMVKQADVFLSNLRAHELVRYQLEYETLKKINPRIIWGNVTGYGKQGPDKDLPAYDATAYWTRGAIPHMISMPGMPVYGYRPGIGDNIVGLGLAYGVMQALYLREKTGIGQAVDISLYHTGMFQMSFDVSGALITGLDFNDWRSQPPPELIQQSLALMMQMMQFFNIKITSPLTGAYFTKDARTLMFVILQPDRYWAKFCKATGHEELLENHKYDTMEGRAEDYPKLRQLFAETFLTKTFAEWHPLLEGIPYAPTQTLKEVVNDVQAIESGCFVEYEHPRRGMIRQVANPINMSDNPADVRMPAPEFGQHTEEVLLEYGYTWEDIAKFKEEGTIA
jgi:crotonobetainyl-CoA:carnitine CoA-transferase CaiB-like acyl-CoA transferase